jgi:hypothetical protein
MLAEAEEVKKKQKQKHRKGGIGVCPCQYARTMKEVVYVFLFTTFMFYFR